METQTDGLAEIARLFDLGKIFSLCLSVGILWAGVNLLNRLATGLGRTLPSRRLLVLQIVTVLSFAIYIGGGVLIVYGVLQPPKELLIALGGSAAVAIGLSLKDLVSSLVAGNKFFHITRIPNSLILMGIGLFVGPTMGWIEVPDLMHVASLTGTLALILILFEGGLELELERVLSSMGKAVALGLATFLLSALAVFLIASLWLQMTPTESLVLALILGGTSPSIILPVGQRLHLPEDSAALVTLECTISELCTVVGVLLAISTLETAENVHGLVVVVKVAQHIVLALVIALVAGMLWGRVSNWLSGVSLSYMLTLSFVCLLYSLAHFFGADGALCVLFFGVVLANAEQVARHIRRFLRPFFSINPGFRSLRFEVDEFLAKFNAELSFLVRTFFFLLLGFLFDLKNWGSVLPYLIVISVALVFARVLVAWVFEKRRPGPPGFFRISATLFPRGLASGSMALIATQSGVLGNPAESAVPNAVLQLTFGAILLTNAAMAVALQFSRDAGTEQPTSAS